MVWIIIYFVKCYKVINYFIIIAFRNIRHCLQDGWSSPIYASRHYNDTLRRWWGKIDSVQLGLSWWSLYYF